MTVEDRLILLLAQARESDGESVFQDMSALRSRLSTRAPDLHGEIQALTVALAKDVPGRIAAAPDQAAARAAAAAEIAQQERLSIAVVTPALDVACRAGVSVLPPVGPPADDAWAGDSIVVGGPPPPGPGPGFGAAPPPYWPPPHQPPPQPPAFGGHQGYAAPPAPYGHAGGPAQPPREPDPWNSYDMSGRPQPFYTKVWFFILIGLLIVGGAILYSQWNHIFGRSTAAKSASAEADRSPEKQKDQPRPPPRPPAPAFRPGGTMLTTTDPTPVVPVQTAPDGRRGLSFSVTVPDGRIDALLELPANGWEGQATITGTTGDGSRSVGVGRFQLNTTDRPSRIMEVQWQQDGVEAGPSAIIFVGKPGQSDVEVSGTGFCLMNSTTREPIACGEAR